MNKYVIDYNKQNNYKNDKYVSKDNSICEDNQKDRRDIIVL